MIQFQTHSKFKQNSLSQTYSKLAWQDQAFFAHALEASNWQQASLAANTMRDADALVVIGIGGSSLGAKALTTAFGESRPVFYLENLDPRGYLRTAHAMKNFSRVQWLVVSKSGNTLETTTLCEFLLQQKYATKKQIAVVTDQNQNALAQWAQANAMNCWRFPVSLGGRYSVFSAVGLIVCAFAGLSLEKMQTGVEWAATRAEKEHGLVSSVSALLLNACENEENNFLWSYSDGLSYFTFWLQQLWAESLGKTEKIPFPIPLSGTRDQHSVLQQIMTGPKNRTHWFFVEANVAQVGDALLKPDLGPIEMIGGRKMGEILMAELNGTRQAINEQGQNTALVALNDWNEANLAALMMIWMQAIVTVAKALELNPYDQPGVELAKILAKNILISK